MSASWPDLQSQAEQLGEQLSRYCEQASQRLIGLPLDEPGLQQLLAERGVPDWQHARARALWMDSRRAAVQAEEWAETTYALLQPVLERELQQVLYRHDAWPETARLQVERLMAQIRNAQAVGDPMEQGLQLLISGVPGEEIDQLLQGEQLEPPPTLLAQLGALLEQAEELLEQLEAAGERTQGLLDQYQALLDGEDPEEQ